MAPPPPLQVEEHEEESAAVQVSEDSEFGPLLISKLEVSER